MLFVHKTSYLAWANIHQEAWQVLADIRQPVLLGLDILVDIRQPILLGLAQLAHIRQRPFLEKNVTRLDTFAWVIRHSREFGASGHCLEKIFLAMRMRERLLLLLPNLCCQNCKAKYRPIFTKSRLNCSEWIKVKTSTSIM